MDGPFIRVVHPYETFSGYLPYLNPNSTAIRAISMLIDKKRTLYYHVATLPLNLVVPQGSNRDKFACQIT